MNLFTIHESAYDEHADAGHVVYAAYQLGDEMLVCADCSASTHDADCRCQCCAVAHVKRRGGSVHELVNGGGYHRLADDLG